MTSRSPATSGSSVIFGSGGIGVASATGCGGAGVGGGGVLGDDVAGGNGLATGGFFLPHAPVTTSRASTTTAYLLCLIAVCSLRIVCRSRCAYRDQLGNLLLPSRVI